MNINERLEYIRKTEKLSRSKFGLKLGKTEDAIYNLEKNRASISKEFIELVCNTFNINKEWILKGTGEMYNTTDFIDINVPDEIKEMIRKFMTLNEKDQEKLNKILDVFISESEN